MHKVEVIRPWNGVQRGQVLVLKEIPAALRANVREIVDQAAAAGPVEIDIQPHIDEAVRQALDGTRGDITRMLDNARREADEIVFAAHEEAGRIRAEAQAAAALAGQLTPATPGAASGAGLPDKERKALITARLKELKVEHDGRKSADELAALLPPDELAALFPAE
ncbi:hypothetical protein [Achromobacter denitrificans]|uniref:hypothetical protein n=1 Tax=Achromobacter denitrificans TaxID=32002 RepID=UPI000F68EE4D|nr:hypothetical protein [Achromobacter denitrificans]RSE88597.1 hypothetical protein EGU64_05080 [Achromobacter denitrificans]